MLRAARALPYKFARGGLRHRPQAAVGGAVGRWRSPTTSASESPSTKDARRPTPQAPLFGTAAAAPVVVVDLESSATGSGTTRKTVAAVTSIDEATSSARRALVKHLVEEMAESSPRRVFSTVMRRLSSEFGEHHGKPLVFPREIILVNGAPGAGKSRNSKFILEARGLSTPPIVMSDLLARTPAHRDAMNAGQLIDDVDVVEVLFRELLLPKYSQGVLVDGFPRTALQADCMHMLRDKMKELRAGKMEELRAEGVFSPQKVPYPVPRFFVCILHVSEQKSIERQIQRGRDAIEHNNHVRTTKIGEIIPVRETDMDESSVRARYEIFTKHRHTLAKLKENFNYTEIDASGDIKVEEQEILKQFQYQSRQDLSKRAFDTIQPILLASRIGMNARSYLVQRIEEYISFYPERFSCAVDMVIRVIIPKLQSAAFAGSATVRIPPESPDYAELSRVEASSFKQMILDSLAERGYTASYELEEMHIPERCELETGKLVLACRKTHVFRVDFPRAKLSNMRESSLNENRENEEPLFAE